MGNMKEKIVLIIAIVIAIAICLGAYYLLFYQETIYYTQIDNTKMETLSVSDDMKYQYTLICYNKNGNKKELKFKTSRKLKEDAYLKLEVMIARGVKAWEEVQYDELPNEVKTNYAK